MRGLWLVVCMLCMAPGALGGGVQIGDVVGNVSFKDIRYLPRHLDDLGERAAYVFAFTTTGDPASEDCLAALKGVTAGYRARNVEVAAVNSGTKDTIMDAALQALLLDAAFTVLKDVDASFAGAVGVTQTPALVVLDGERRLRYRGDAEGLLPALDAVLAGEAVGTPERAVRGTPIVVRETPEPAGAITFAEHVTPIVYKNCVECHRPGGNSPFPLVSYADVSARANMIVEVTREERMPPWYASRHHGQFVNERGLTQQEKDVLVQWVRGGKPEGDMARAAKVPEFPKTEWEIGEPDLVVTASKVEEIPAEGFIPYRYVVLPYQFPEDTWIQGIEILPANMGVVHHVNLAYSVSGEGYEEKFNFLTGRVPGGAPVDLQGNLAMLLPKGSGLVLQIHYVTTGKPETDQMRVGFRYAKDTVKKRVYYKRIRPQTISIPPGDPFHAMSAEREFERNATALAVFSHMHVRGRDMSFFAVYPDGREETLCIIPNYSFDWQLAYLWMPGMKTFPKGTRIRTVSHYDNSPFNAYNPDPAATVPYGDQTVHEMNDGYIFYLDADEDLNLAVDPSTGIARQTAVASAL